MNQETENAIKDWLRNQGYESQEEIEEQMKNIKVEESKITDFSHLKFKIDSASLKESENINEQMLNLHPNSKKLPKQPLEDQRNIQYINPIENNAKEILSKRRNK